MTVLTPADSPTSQPSTSPMPRLVATLAATLLITTAVLAGLLVLVNAGDAWRGLLPAAVVATLAAGVSLVPLALGLRSTKPERIMGGFIFAGMVRMAVTVGGGMLAVSVGGYPLQATMLLLVVFYLAVLAVEATVLAKFLWGLTTKRA